MESMFNSTRMITFLLFIAAVAISHEARSTESFQHVLGGPDLDRGVFVSPTSDGGYIAIGLTKSFGKGDEDVYLVRTDATGKTLWTRTYGGTEKDNGWSVHEIENGFILAGFTSSFGAGGFDCYLIRTDTKGETQWWKTYGGEKDDRCWALAQASQGGYVIVGETNSSGAGAEDCFLIKTDESGNEIWSQTFGGKNGDRCFSLAETDDGGFLLVGQTYSEGAGDRDAYLIKTNKEGSREWSKTFGGPASDVGHSVTGADDGSFVIIGYTASFSTADGDDPYITKVDGSGKIRWTRVLPMKGINRTLTGEQAADGGFFLAGFSAFPSDDATAALLIRTNEDGHLDWSKNIFFTTTGESLGYTVRATSDGGCILTGHTTEGSAGTLDLFLVKVDSGGK